MLQQTTLQALQTLHLQDLEENTSNIQQCPLLSCEDIKDGSKVSFISRKKITSLLLRGQLVSIMILVDREKLDEQIKMQEVGNG